MRRSILLISLVFVCLFSIGANAPAQTAGVFEVRFDDSALTAQQQTELAPTLAATKSFWESVITGYQPGITLDGIDVVVSAMPIDGPSNTLAFGGAGGFIIEQGGFTFFTDAELNSSAGSVTIDTADFSSPLIVDVLNHEVGHALGFGTLFDLNSLAPNPGQYTGSGGLTAYQAEFDSNATSVPLQNETLPDGTIIFNFHLDEANPLSDAFGRTAQAALMTPTAENTTNAKDPFSNFLSDTSLGIFRDLGYETVDTTFVAREIQLGDVNQDGAVDFLDISPFISILSTDDFLEEADINQDGTVDFLDISPFITILSNN